jgi:hypothetical protein
MYFKIIVVGTIFLTLFLILYYKYESHPMKDPFVMGVVRGCLLSICMGGDPIQIVATQSVISSIVTGIEKLTI